LLVENPFFAIVDTKCVATGAPLGPHWAPSGHPVGTQWVQSGHYSRLSGSIDAGQYYFIKLHIQSSLCVIKSWRTRYILGYHVYYSITYTYSNRDRGKVHDRKLARRVNTKILMMFRGLGIIESIVQRRSS